MRRGSFAGKLDFFVSARHTNAVVADPTPLYYVTAVVVAALTAWVISVLVRRDLPPFRQGPRP